MTRSDKNRIRQYFRDPEPPPPRPFRPRGTAVVLTPGQVSDYSQGRRSAAAIGREIGKSPATVLRALRRQKAAVQRRGRKAVG